MQRFPATLFTLCFAAAVVGAQSNVLVLVADDVGVDHVGAYGEGADLPATPAIDELAEAGVLFRNAWANTLCTPSRAVLMTGRYSLRTGMGDLIKGDNQPLPHAEVTLPELLEAGAPGTWATGFFGKWHLSNANDGWPIAPNEHGWQHFAGTRGNFSGFDGFYSHELVVNGEATLSTTYATTETVDHALAWIDSVSGPWLAVVSFHAAHTPLHAPPPWLHSVDLTLAGHPDDDPRPYYKAMVEAMDTEIGRLLEQLGDELTETTVIFVGDNGSPGTVVVPPFVSWHSKTTPYEGGLNVPLIVRRPSPVSPLESAFQGSEGEAAAGAESAALVSIADVFATLAEIAEADPVEVLPAGLPLDSISLVPYLLDPGLPSLREFAYAEHFKPNGPGPWIFRERAARDSVHKLIRRDDAPDELFDLVQDPFEQRDLLELPALTPVQERAYRKLSKFIENL